MRWNGAIYEVSETLESSADHGPEYISFWIKRPASTAVDTVGALQTGLVNPSNEPVDETLVRTLLTMNGRILTPGTIGVAPLVEYAYGIIPFDGGDQPDFYDFTIFQSNVSLVSCPSPVVDVDDPWVIRNVGSNFTSETVDINNTSGPEHYVQSRAMRKLPAGTGLLFIFGVISLLTTDSTPITINVGGDIRLLMKSGFSV